MRIAVCDDNLTFLCDIEKRLRKESFVSDVIVFHDPKELLSEIENRIQFELLLMDIEFKEKENGFDYGEKIFNLSPELPIIYITGYNDRFAQHLMLTNLNLLGYITKPVNDEILKRYLQKAIHYHSLHSRYFMISLRNRKISLKTDEIIYIESDNHQVTLYTNTEKYTFYQKISELQKKLPDEFVQCHKSFLVNMGWINSIEYKTVILKNEKQIPISRTYRENFQNSFFRFLREKV